MAAEWYCLDMGERIGPLSLQELKDRLDRGEVARDQLVWSSSLPEWTPVWQVEALSAGSQPPPPTDDQVARSAKALKHTGLRPHRGGSVLAWGIIGLLMCFPVGYVAWSMGSRDLKLMRAGVMDPSGELLTQAGRACGMVAGLLPLAVLLMGIGVLAFPSCVGNL